MSFFRTTTHLPGKCKRFLVKPLLLWVPNVGRDDLAEWYALRVILELVAENFGFDGKFSTDGVLDVEDVGVEGFGGEGTHGSDRGAEGPS
jgi:hypothetical protein